jgi:lysophospholipase L1-like esterase
MKKSIVLIALLCCLGLQSQEIKHIAGGGTLSDWAFLGRFQADNAAVSATEDPNRVVFMGNSITEGWKHFRPEFFEDNPYINRGIGGQTTPQMLIRFKPDVIHLKPKAVVILAGINDIAGNTGPTELSTIFDNLTSMAEIAQAHNIRVLMCSVLPAKDFPWSPGLEPAPKVVALNQMIEKYCKEQGHTYVDYYSAMEDGQGGLKVPEFTSADDLVHPNKAGYLVMEAILKKALQN